MNTDTKRISIRKYARGLRANQTPAERALWWLILLGYRRQRPIHGYVPDFYSPLWRVAVEVNGSIHKLPATRKRDRTKRRALMSHGIYTLYVSNTYALRAWPIVLLEVAGTGAMWLAWCVVVWTWRRVRV